MKRTWFVCFALAAPAAPAGAAPEDPPDPAGEVRAVFAAKCATCHGPLLARPKGRFGYVLDLGRVAGNPEMVVPGKPDESELWELIRRGEMPPEDAPAGPLTAEEKEAVRSWIEAGARANPQPAGGTSSTPETPARPGDGRPPSSEIWRVFRWAGRFHLLFLHFPIALLLAAAAGELWSAVRGERSVVPAVRFCVNCGAAAAVPTVALGWLFAAGGAGEGAPALLLWHRWLGTAAAAWAVAAALALERDARHGLRTWGARLLLAAGALLVGAAAHFGGALTRGQDFFTR